MNMIEQRKQLVVERMKLDKFFSMFLEKFERKMDPDKIDTPIWKLYKMKLKEYDNVSHQIKTLDYWIKKGSHV